MRNQHADTFPHIKPQVGGDLLIPAAPRMQFQAEIPYLLNQFQLDKVVNILGVRAHGFRLMLGSIACIRLLLKTNKDGLEAIHNLRVFSVAQHARGQQRPRVRLAGHELLGQ